ncbi:MAG: hypothetical protein KKB02_08555, partial [Alphaproteobacteria bacterium]|nr:hypothetical protein [Alphaproteobacteria bacterium]
MRRRTILLLFVLAGLGAVAPDPPRAQGADPEDVLTALADAARAQAGQLDFDAFRDATTFLPETGKYYVSGDTPIRNVKLLREFWDNAIRRPPVTAATDDAAPEFAVAVVGGLDQIWGTERHALTYCVSDAFGARQAPVMTAMAE